MCQIENKFIIQYWVVGSTYIKSGLYSKVISDLELSSNISEEYEALK